MSKYQFNHSCLEDPSKGLVKQVITTYKVEDNRLYEITVTREFIGDRVNDTCETNVLVTGEDLSKWMI